MMQIKNNNRLVIWRLKNVLSFYLIQIIWCFFFYKNSAHLKWWIYNCHLSNKTYDATKKKINLFYWFLRYITWMKFHSSQKIVYNFFRLQEQ